MLSTLVSWRYITWFCVEWAVLCCLVLCNKSVDVFVAKEAWTAVVVVFCFAIVECHLPPYTETDTYEHGYRNRLSSLPSASYEGTGL